MGEALKTGEPARPGPAPVRVPPGKRLAQRAEAPDGKCRRVAEKFVFSARAGAAVRQSAASDKRVPTSDNDRQLPPTKH